MGVFYSQHFHTGYFVRGVKESEGMNKIFRCGNLVWLGTQEQQLNTQSRRKHHMKKFLAIATTVAIVAMTGSAFAATTSTNLSVNASVSAACVAATTTNIDFGTLDPINDAATTLASGKTSAGLINVKCTQGTSYTLSTPATATIANGANSITYTPVYSAAANSGLVAGTNHTIDASVDKTAYATAPAGAYTGTLTVTVTY
jgi:spore coat protein U-like protein